MKNGCQDWQLLQSAETYLPQHVIAVWCSVVWLRTLAKELGQESRIGSLDVETY